MTSNDAPTVRFAPSPTGFLHIGNIRTALYNWLLAKRGEGTFILRLDDTDAERSTEAFADAIVEDLAWLGIEPDRIERQSARRDRHKAAADRLREAGLLYPCYETPDELERQRARQRARRLPPIYDRRALKQTDEERAAFEAEGRKPHWRFLLPNFEADPHLPRRTERSWDDLARGPQTVDLASMSDPVLVRDDGSFLYTLPSVVDDTELGVTDVVRGDDHVTNTGAQIALFEALGAAPPRFGHHNLLAAEDGSGLSKRTGALSIRSLRDDGHEPMAVASLAVTVGTSENVEQARDLAELGRRISLSDTSHSVARFAMGELEQLTAAIVHELDYAAVASRLRHVGVPDAVAEPLWAAVRENCAKVSDAASWWQRLVDPPRQELEEEDAEFVRQAIDALPEGTVDETTWKTWTGALKATTGRKGRALFMPLRLALTGVDHGPELGRLLPLIGREGILGRRP